MQGILDYGWMHAPSSLGSDMKILEDSEASANIEEIAALTVLSSLVQKLHFYCREQGDGTTPTFWRQMTR